MSIKTKEIEKKEVSIALNKKILITVGIVLIFAILAGLPLLTLIDYNTFLSNKFMTAYEKWKTFSKMLFPYALLNLPILVIAINLFAKKKSSTKLIAAMCLISFFAYFVAGGFGLVAFSFEWDIFLFDFGLPYFDFAAAVIFLFMSLVYFNAIKSKAFLNILNWALFILIASLIGYSFYLYSSQALISPSAAWSIMQLFYSIGLIVLGFAFSVQKTVKVVSYEVNDSPEAQAVHASIVVDESVDLEQRSYFDGNIFQLFCWKLLGNIITICTLGICLPWAKTMVMKWETKHTVIEGYRLAFDGRAIQLWGKWLLWCFLSVITLGIYLFWLNNGLRKWVAKHTYFEGTENTGNSYFDGSIFQLFGWKLLGNIITICTLGICLPWAKTMVMNWETKHRVVEGFRLAFNGKAVQLWGKWILWCFLSVITLGIFLFWLANSLKKWTAKHTHFSDVIVD